VSYVPSRGGGTYGVHRAPVPAALYFSSLGPPLRIERLLFLSRRLNPFFKHGDARLFLAERDGRPVGRISAHYDEAFNAYHDNRWGMFGFLEIEDDPEVLPALLDAARRGCAPAGATAWSARWTSR
jgi:hypothetical protein